MNLSWKAFALGSALFAALTALFGRIGVAEMNSDLATCVRTIVILLMSALVVTVRGEWVRPQSLSTAALAAILLSGAATGLSWLCYYRALQLAPASRVAPVDKLSVVLVVLFGALFLHEQITWKVGLGAAFVSLGAAIMVM
ncbi:MAG: EamA family transporter [Steroidobacteraceae bacterium]|jgi:bacterial/archaeal transporter family protein